MIFIYCNYSQCHMQALNCGVLRFIVINSRKWRRYFLWLYSKVLLSEFYRNLKGRCYLGDLGVDWKLILKFVKKIVHEGVDWINLVQNKFQSRIIVNTVMELLGSIKGREFLKSWVTFSFSRRTVFDGGSLRELNFSLLMQSSSATPSVEHRLRVSENK
jgi:hypothetical protein